MAAADLPSMKTATPLPADDQPVTRTDAQKKSAGGLNLTPEQAKREADKLHETRDDLETRRTPDETSARSSPLGRHDE